MRRVIVVSALIASAAVASLVKLSATEPEAPYRPHRTSAGMPRYVPGEVIVGFATGTSQAAVEHAALDIGAVRMQKNPFGGPYLATLEQGTDEDGVVERLRSMREVAYAERNGYAHVLLSPNDQFFAYQWNFRMLNMQRSWDIQKGDPSVVVAVVDTGIAYEDFGIFRKAPDWGSVTFVTGFNALTRNEHANDDEGHGTHVASTVAEATNNDIGATGLCFQCGLMPVKVLNSQGSGSFFNIAAGIDYVVNFRQNGVNPVKVINLSLGGDFIDQTLRTAIQRALSAGIVVVAASGNDDSVVSFPASLPGVIAVGAVNAIKRRASYSNHGPELSVVAPGGDDDGFRYLDDDRDGIPDGVWQQTFNFNLPIPARYQSFALVPLDGTSMASPHVAALAALLVRQGITDPAAVKKAIESTAEDLGAAGRDDEFGFGLIRPTKALEGLGINK